MTKVRVYEVARELGVENRDLIQRIATLGIHHVQQQRSLLQVDLAFSDLEAEHAVRAQAHHRLLAEL